MALKFVGRQADARSEGMVTFGCVTISRRPFTTSVRQTKTAGSRCFNFSRSFRTAGATDARGLERKGNWYGDMSSASCSIQIDSGWASILRRAPKHDSPTNGLPDHSACVAILVQK